nr:hypothetical protein BaRGS_002072 [Batillaria attramentaria]
MGGREEAGLMQKHAMQEDQIQGLSVKRQSREVLVAVVVVSAVGVVVEVAAMVSRMAGVASRVAGTRAGATRAGATKVTASRAGAREVTPMVGAHKARAHKEWDMAATVDTVNRGKAMETANMEVRAASKVVTEASKVVTVPSKAPMAVVPSQLVMVVLSPMGRVVLQALVQELARLLGQYFRNMDLLSSESLGIEGT